MSVLQKKENFSFIDFVTAPFNFFKYYFTGEFVKDINWIDMLILVSIYMLATTICKSDLNMFLASILACIFVYACIYAIFYFKFCWGKPIDQVLITMNTLKVSLLMFIFIVVYLIAPLLSKTPVTSIVSRIITGRASYLIVFILAFFAYFGSFLPVVKTLKDKCN